MVSHMARRVARSMNDDDVERTKFELLIVSDVAIRAKGWNHQWQAEHSRLKVWILRLGFLQRMNQHLGARKMLFDDRVIGEMIKMAVRQPQADEVPSAFCSFVEKPFGSVIRCIEEHGLFRIFVGDNETVRHRDAAGVGEDNHLATQRSADIPVRSSVRTLLGLRDENAGER